MKLADGPSEGEWSRMEPERSDLLRDLVARTVRALEDRGLTVLPAAVESVVDGLVDSAAERVGIPPNEALHLVEPEQIAELIVQAESQAKHASVRPIREDRTQANIAAAAAGQLINALSQAAKMAVTNGAGETALHAVDLLSEFGAGVTAAASPALVGMERGALAEAAQVIDRVAEAFEGGAWSTCPCRRDHGQREADHALPKVFRADADMARQLLLSDLARGD